MTSTRFTFAKILCFLGIMALAISIIIFIVLAFAINAIYTLGIIGAIVGIYFLIIKITSLNALGQYCDNKTK